MKTKTKEKTFLPKRDLEPWSPGSTKPVCKQAMLAPICYKTFTKNHPYDWSGIHSQLYVIIFFSFDGLKKKVTTN